jgi:hypothetical protein
LVRPYVVADDPKELAGVAAGLQYARMEIRIDNFSRNSTVLSPGASYWSTLNGWKSRDKVGTGFQSYSLSEDEDVLLENSIVCVAGLVETASGATECDEAEQVSSHEARLSNFGFWVTGSPAIGVLGLQQSQNHHYDRKSSIIQL